MLEMDAKGNLYLYKSALLCKSEIIKRLTEDNYTLVEPSILGNATSKLKYYGISSNIWCYSGLRRQ